MKIGLILANYNCNDTLHKCLGSWMTLKANKVLNLTIACLDGLFTGFEKMCDSARSTDGSFDYLESAQDQGLIDYLDIFENLDEAAARNIALRRLLADDVDYIISIGADEYFTEKEIIECFRFVQNNKEFISTYRINYRNLVFDMRHYVDGFCPKRIWATKLKSHVSLKEFRYDDDMVYMDMDGRLIVDDMMACLTVPKHCANPLHETWLSNERSRQKVAYQTSPTKWGKNGCSFKWNDAENRLEFNLEHYALTKSPIPEVFEIK